MPRKRKIYKFNLKVVKLLPEVTYLIVGIVLIFFVIVVLAPCIEVYMGGFLFSAYL